MGAKKLPAIQVPEDPTVLGYLAGLFDADGHVGVSATFDKRRSVNTSTFVTTCITNTDLAVMVWLVDTVGGSVQASKRPRDKANWKPAHYWHLYGKNAETFLEAILPWLIVKRERAETALELRRLRRDGKTLSDDLVVKRAALKARMNRLNQRGIPLAQ